MRLVTIKGTDMYGNPVEETVDLDETFEQMLEKVCGRKIPVTYVIVPNRDKGEKK